VRYTCTFIHLITFARAFCYSFVRICGRYISVEHFTCLPRITYILRYIPFVIHCYSHYVVLRTFHSIVVYTVHCYLPHFCYCCPCCARYHFAAPLRYLARQRCSHSLPLPRGALFPLTPPFVDRTFVTPRCPTIRSPFTHRFRYVCCDSAPRTSLICCLHTHRTFPGLVRRHCNVVGWLRYVTHVTIYSVARCGTFKVLHSRVAFTRLSDIAIEVLHLFYTFIVIIVTTSPCLFPPLALMGGWRHTHLPCLFLLHYCTTYCHCYYTPLHCYYDACCWKVIIDYIRVLPHSWLHSTQKTRTHLLPDHYEHRISCYYIVTIPHY